MYVFESAFQTLRKYADFKSRASRQEFWCFLAFVIIMQAVCGVLGITLLAFANLLTLFLKKGSSVPNRYGAAPTAFSFAR